MLGEKWKAQIAQSLPELPEARSIHFVDPNAYGNGWEYNQHQLRRRQYLDQLKKQLAEQKKKLENI